ncbi:amino acid kinase [Halteromyces radiatus]|uniref:amino acid kinase n=1 Tax=Halteromyces radiatus TaxID=101107 RepID=UPI002220FC89|nr:amino acid kinase [Halteromyces radiatus]KAI8097775.1 amino acid kinase [Halteromyces radiatus]
MPTVIVKLGGAAITNKKNVNQLSCDLDRLVDQVFQSYQHLQQLPDRHDLILIHGAGSFGHPPAKKYHIKRGWLHDTIEQQKFGFALTRQHVDTLHHHLLERLLALGLPVCTVPAFDHVETNQGLPSQESSHRLCVRVHQLVSLGFIPLLFGDAVLDTSLGCTILSGDVLMYELASHLSNVARCIFVTDVQGIYSDDPKTNPKATLIKHINNTLDNQLFLANTNKSIDVTGGMNGKVIWIRRILQDTSVPEVIICQAGSKEVPYAITLQPLLTGDDSPLDQVSLTLFTNN